MLDRTALRGLGLLALGAGALLAALASRDRSSGRSLSDDESHVMTAAATPPAPSTSSSSGSAIAPADPRSETSETERALEAEGWTIVNEPRPDQAIVDFDPSLLKGGEAKLRAQMASAAPRERHVPNLATIARRASDATTRALAIDTLGHVDSPSAQRELLDLLGALDRSDPARRNIAPLLHPPSSDDPFASELARRVEDTRLDRVEREQIAFTLALVAERDGRVGTAPFYGELSPEGKKTLARMGALARGNGEAAKRPEVGP